MAAGIGNPVGYLPLFDGGVPRAITGMAISNISGGVFVFGSSASNPVSSGADTFVTTDLLWVGDASGTQFNGVAMFDAGSNTELSVATRGVILALADGAVLGGAAVVTRGVNGVSSASLGSLAQADTFIGRALLDATSGNYTLVDINP